MHGTAPPLQLQMRHRFPRDVVVEALLEVLNTFGVQPAGLYPQIHAESILIGKQQPTFLDTVDLPNVKHIKVCFVCGTVIECYAMDCLSTPYLIEFHKDESYPGVGDNSQPSTSSWIDIFAKISQY